MSISTGNPETVGKRPSHGRRESLDRLNDAYRQARERLFLLNLGVTASVKVSPDVRFAWMKRSEMWGLFAAESDIAGLGEYKPILECKVPVRVACAWYLPALQRAMEAAAAEEGKQLAAAAEAAELFVKGGHPPGTCVKCGGAVAMIEEGLHRCMNCGHGNC